MQYLPQLLPSSRGPAQAEVRELGRAGLALLVEAAGRVVRVDHGPQPGWGEPGLPARGEPERLGKQPFRQPVVSRPPPLPEVVDALGRTIRRAVRRNSAPSTCQPVTA